MSSFIRSPFSAGKGIIFFTSARPIHLLEEDNNIVLLDILMYYNVFRIHLVYPCIFVRNLISNYTNIDDISYIESQIGVVKICCFLFPRFVNILNGVYHANSHDQQLSIRNTRSLPPLPLL